MSSIDSLPAIFHSEIRRGLLSFVYDNISCGPSNSEVSYEPTVLVSPTSKAQRTLRLYETASALDGLGLEVQKIGVMVYGLLTYSRGFRGKGEQLWQAYWPSSSLESTLFLFEMNPQEFSIKQREGLLYWTAERGLLQKVRSILQRGVSVYGLNVAQKLALENNHIDTAWAIYCCSRGWAEKSSNKELMNWHASVLHELQDYPKAFLREEMMDYLQRQCKIDAHLRKILEEEFQEERAARKAEIAMDESTRARLLLRTALDHNRVEWVWALLATPHSQLSRATWTETLLSVLNNPSFSEIANVLLEARKWSNAEVSYILRSLVQSGRLPELNRVLASPLVCTKEALQRAWVFAEVLGHERIAQALDRHLREQTASA